MKKSLVLELIGRKQQHRLGMQCCRLVLIYRIVNGDDEHANCQLQMVTTLRYQALVHILVITSTTPASHSIRDSQSILCAVEYSRKSIYRIRVGTTVYY